MEKDVNSKIADLKKSFESVKTESLKNAVQETINSFNENLKSIASKLVNHLDEINSLKSRVAEIEDLF